MDEHRIGSLEKQVESLRVRLGKLAKYICKQWKISYILFFISAGFMYFGAFMLLVTPAHKELTINNTKEYTATISKIQPLPYYGIQVEEYNAILIISYSDIVMDFDALTTLSVGQTITFRISNKDIPRLSKITEQIDFASLTFNGTEIITLESVNEYLSFGKYSGIVLCVPATIFLIIGIAIRKHYLKKINEFQDPAINETSMNGYNC